jgi:hypothetical protein
VRPVRTEREREAERGKKAATDDLELDLDRSPEK